MPHAPFTMTKPCTQRRSYSRRKKRSVGSGVGLVRYIISIVCSPDAEGHDIGPTVSCSHPNSGIDTVVLPRQLPYIILHPHFCSWLSRNGSFKNRLAMTVKKVRVGSR
jgi:hypothetical protein